MKKAPHLRGFFYVFFEMIYVVSGLPRSGTSMMMQMIERSGLEILSDHLRTADHSNPKGYFEYEPVKKLAADNSWLDQADGKCVKIIAQLLPYLKKDLSYKIIFMDRPIEEVLVSQNVMLGKKDQPVNPAIGEVFKKSLDQVFTMIANSSNMELIRVPYHDVVSNPENVALIIAKFIGKDDKYSEMAMAVDPNLYRNKLK
ncbi:MAG TPA: hypothetical protein PK798_10555 [Flavobacteriales bacterium]|nr:hypothetical protein [Flavobacteriales bacterium]HRJ39221.1 hypothetical protein [Flavobacteriales bacterium]